MDILKENRFIQNQRSLSFAVMNCHYIKFPLDFFFDSMQRVGLNNIELFGAMPHFFMDDVDDKLIDRVVEACKKRNLKIVSFTPAQGAYPVNIAIDEKQVRTRSIKLLKRSIDASAKLGCSTMLVSSGFGYQTESRDISWGVSRESLCELAEFAGKHGITLMIEPLTPMTSNIINTSVQAARMIAEVNSPYLKSIMDIGVMNYMGESVESYFANLGDNLVYIHFTDGPGAHVALGDGNFPMAQYAENIKKEGYTGYCSFEINDRRYLLNPDEAISKNINWLKTHGYSD